jgi:methionyl aminopeptidase
MVAACSSRNSYRQEREGIPIKDSAEIKLMKEACSRAAKILEEMVHHAKPGMTTYDLDRFGKGLMDKLQVESACFGYPGERGNFPSYTCISIDREVVHGVASLNRLIEEGSLVSIDVVVRYQGYIGDNARSFILGAADPERIKLLEITKNALVAGIQHAKNGNRIGDISHSIQKMVEQAGFSVIREFVGHGVGTSMHEAPQIPNYGRRGIGPKIRPGMTLAIEPMVNMGRKEIDILSDGWTVVTRDGLPSAHFEHTVLVLSDGVEILTSAN